MRTETDDEPGDHPEPTTITLRRGEVLDVWIAEDAMGVTSQGTTREAALENLDEAVPGYDGAGEAPSDEELEALGIDPQANTAADASESAVFDP